MGQREIRLNSILYFDEDQEKDVIELYEGLTSTHKVGKYIANLFRIAVDNPEVFKYIDGKYEPGVIMQQLDTYGMSMARDAFFKNCNKSVIDMKDKVDSMYKMVMDMYTLAIMGKRLGIEDKTDNAMLATFILEKQVNDLQNKLGVKLNSAPFASNKVENKQKFVDDAMELLINTYGDLIEELKSIRSTEIVQCNPIQSSATNQVSTQPIVSNSVQENNKGNSSTNVEDEPVDFGEADMAALANFFGETF